MEILSIIRYIILDTIRKVKMPRIFIRIDISETDSESFERIIHVAGKYLNIP